MAGATSSVQDHVFHVTGLLVNVNCGRGLVFFWGGAPSRLSEYAGGYLQGYVCVRLLRRESSTCEGGGGGLSTRWVAW